MTLAYTLKVLYSRIRKLYRDFFSGTNPLIFLDIVCGHQDCCKRFLAIASAAAAVVKCTTVCMHRPSMWQRSAPLGAASDWLIDRWSHITAQTAGYFPMRSFHAIFLRQTLADYSAFRFAILGLIASVSLKIGPFDSTTEWPQLAGVCRPMCDLSSQVLLSMWTCTLCSQRHRTLNIILPRYCDCMSSVWLSVRPSVCLWRWWIPHRWEILET